MVCHCASSSIRLNRISGFKDKPRQVMTQCELLVQPVQNEKGQLQEVVNALSLEMVKHGLESLLMRLFQIRLNHQVGRYDL